MDTHRIRHHKRTNLFLLRMWTEDLSDGEGNTDVEWHGSLRRVVDGEVRQFKGWQSLAEALLAMLSASATELGK